MIYESSSYNDYGFGDKTFIKDLRFESPSNNYILPKIGVENGEDLYRRLKV